MSQLYLEMFRTDLSPENAQFLFKSLVRNIEIAISSYCNRTCSYCPNSLVDRRSRQEYMSDELYFSILMQLRSIRYSGSLDLHRYNEPLADPDYALRRIREAKRFLPSAVIRIFTNGDNLDKQLVFELSKAGVGNIAVSTHVLGGDLDFKAVLRRQNEQLEKLGMPFQYLPPNLQGRTALVSTGTSTELTWVAQNFYSHDEDGVLNMMDRGQSLSVDTHFCRQDPCLVPFHEMQIEWNGMVVPCCNIHTDLPQHSQYILEHLTPLSDIFSTWTNANFAAWRKRLFNYDVKPRPCTTCHYARTGDNETLRQLMMVIKSQSQ